MQHVFISYVRENEEIVDKLCKALESYGIKVWLDRNDIDPGSFWKQAIREAIREGAFFIACFSKEYNKRDKTYMNEELTLAIDELRQRPADRVWFIPVKLNKCEIPDIDIRQGKTLQDLQYVSLYEDWDAGILRILRVIQPKLSEPISDSNTVKLWYSRKKQHIEPRVIDFLDRGVKAHEEGNLDRAIDYYSATIQLNSELAPPYYNRGVAYLRKGKIDKAIEDFSKTIEMKPNYTKESYKNGDDKIKNEIVRDIFANAYYKRGVAYVKKHVLDAAIKDYSEAIQIDPNFAEAYIDRAVVFSLENKYDLAFEDYEQAVRLKPHYVNIYNNRGCTYRSKGEIARSISDFTTAITIEPEFSMAYYNRGITWLMLKKWEKARTDLLTAQNLGMNIITMFHNLHTSISDFEKKNNIQLPEHIAEMLTPPQP